MKSTGGQRTGTPRRILNPARWAPTAKPPAPDALAPIRKDAFRALIAGVLIAAAVVALFVIGCAPARAAGHRSNRLTAAAAVE